MLVHHDSRSYNEAASAAAANAREKLGQLIERGRSRAHAVLEQVEREVPQDRLARAGAITFHDSDDMFRLSFAGQDVQHLRVHDHALEQATERLGMPWRYLQALRGRGTWGRELVRDNLNRLAENHGGRFLVRQVTRKDGLPEVRGIMSDRFRRLDSRPIIEAFCKAAGDLGAVPVEGYAMETKVALKALLPRVFEPVPNEVMAFGAILQNSDFGDGALSIRVFMLRLFCTNYAITDEALRQVHLGGALPDNVEFSQRTYELDTRRSASMVRDILGRELSPARVNQACELVQRADADKVTPGQVSAFVKKHLGVTDAADVVGAFSSADVENMPPGQTSWRLSNALSWVAGKQNDEAKRLELMKVAGLALPGSGLLHSAN